jgi:CheY-like chemotaxis protein
LGDAPRPVLLVIEDDPHERLLYKTVLEGEGYEVFTAQNGPEALSLFANVRPALVVLDICMPGMDGIDLMNRLLARDNGLAIVVNTAYACYGKDFHLAAADAFVLKSSDTSELRDAVHKVLEFYQKE